MPINFDNAIEPAFAAVKDASQLEINKQHAAYLGEQATQMRMKTQEMQEAKARDNQYVDLTKHPIMQGRSEGAQKAILESFQGMGLGKQSQGGYVVQNKELREGLGAIMTNPQMFDRISAGEVADVLDQYERANADLSTSKAKFEKDPKNQALALEIKDKEKVAGAILDRYNRTVGNVEMLRDKVNVLSKLKQLENDGVWQQLPKELRVALSTAPDLKSMGKIIEEYAKAAEKAKLQDVKDKAAMERENVKGKYHLIGKQMDKEGRLGAASISANTKEKTAKANKSILVDPETKKQKAVDKNTDEYDSLVEQGWRPYKAPKEEKQPINLILDTLKNKPNLTVDDIGKALQKGQISKEDALKLGRDKKLIK